MDVCHYCNQQYHPMPVHQHPQTGKRIWVCEYHLTPVPVDRADELIAAGERVYFTPKGPFFFTRSDCRERAETDGYVYRRDLTPTR